MPGSAAPLLGPEQLHSPAPSISWRLWQEPLFDPHRSQGTRWAEGIGMNTLRVFWHDLLCSKTRPLPQANRCVPGHRSQDHIRPVLAYLILAGSFAQARAANIHHTRSTICWSRAPASRLGDAAEYPRLKAYVAASSAPSLMTTESCVGRCGTSPGNATGEPYGKWNSRTTVLRSDTAAAGIEWARSVRPRAPDQWLWKRRLSRWTGWNPIARLSSKPIRFSFLPQLWLA